MKAIIPILLSCLFCAGPVWGQEKDAEQEMRPGEIWSGCWEVSLLGHRSTGRFCWLSGTAQELRLEIGQEIAPDSLFREDTDLPRTEFLLPLFQRTGRGWTAVLGSGRTGTLQAWGREWDALPPVLGIWIRTLLGGLDRLGLPLGHGELPDDVRLLAAGRGRSSSTRGWARACPGSASEAGLRLELPEFRAQPEAEAEAEAADRQAGLDFRRMLTARGQGRGGQKEILSILVQAGRPGDPDLLTRVTSSRKPGKLDLAISPGLPVAFYYPEIFSPLWPLADLVKMNP